MIDVSVYDLTEEQARMILAHLDMVRFFYIFGVLVFSTTVIYCAVLGCIYFLKKYENYKSKKENKK